MKDKEGRNTRRPLGYKPEGLERLIFEIFDGMAPWKPRNEKVTQGRKFEMKIEADMYYGSETRANWEKLGLIVN